MARKKRPPEHENHERWLVSYADFITLLFAFFVVMFATSQTDKGKAQQVSTSVKRALEGEKMSRRWSCLRFWAARSTDTGKGNAMMHGPGGASTSVASAKKDEKLAELLPSLKVLTEELKSEIAAGRIQISMEARGLVVSFKQAVLFPSGEDVISTGAYPDLEKLAAAIAKIPNPVRLEGHTRLTPHQNRSIPQQLGSFRRSQHRAARTAERPLRLAAQPHVHRGLRRQRARGVE